MKSKNIILIIVVAVSIICVFYMMESSQDDTTYVQQIEKERQERDDFMKNSKESPFITNNVAFKALKYFPIDAKYRIIADLEPIQSKKVQLLATSDGKEERYVEYAYAKFTIDGIENRLLILEMMAMGPIRGKLFLAFADETSGLETYGAGRYLDVNKVPGSSTITLDFNKAYNPYCAYVDSYSCPFPPKENLLKVPIKAGEKNYKE